MEKEKDVIEVDVLSILGIFLLLIGLFLAGVEMVLPGFGLPGISGAISLVAGVALLSKSVEQALTILVILVVILAIMLTCILVFFQSRKVKSPLRLEEELGKKDGFLNAEDLAYLVGKEGETETDLRPTGKCDMEGISFEVRSENGFIEKGKKVKVIKIQSNSLIVKECI